MSDVDWAEAGDAESPDEHAAPPLLHLSEPLPSSVTRLGLSPALPTRSNGAAAAAAAASSNLSFRVLAVHVDDVAEDVVLVCESNITLLLPLEPAAAAEVAGVGGLREKQPQHQRQAPPSATNPNATTPVAPTAPSPTTVPAACLRLAGAVQVWTHPSALPSRTSGPHGATTSPPPPPQPSPALSPSLAFTGSGTSSTSGLCLPRRLPSTVQELRRAPSVLVAVPVPPASASAAAPAAALRNAPTALTSARASVAASPPSPPASTTSSPLSVPPPVMAVYIMACPVLPEGVDDIPPRAVPFARPLAKYVCAPNTLRFRDAWYPVLHLSWCNGASRTHTAVPGRVAPGGASLFSKSRLTSNLIASDDDEDDGGGSAVPARYVDHHLLCASSICVDLVQVRCTIDPVVAATMPVVAVSVLQRYVTHTDWCTYDPCSRVLLCLNHARPAVLKPLEVYTQACTESGECDWRGGGPPVALRTWAELSLPGSLCVALQPDIRTAAASASSELSLRLMQAPSTSPLLSSVVGALTVYGQPCIYHITRRSCSGDVADGAELLVLQLYLHLPGKPTTTKATSATSQPPSHTTKHGEGAPRSDAPVTSSGGRHDSILKRLTTAASAASGSAPPPAPCKGDTYLPVAQLSLWELTAGAISDSANTRSSPLSAGFVSAAAVSASWRRQQPPPPPQQQQQSRLQRGSLPICVHVVDNLLLVHSPATRRSAVYDLADRISNSGCGGSGGRRSRDSSKRHGSDALTARAYVLWVSVSDASRAWARAHPPQKASSAAQAADAAAGPAPWPALRSTPLSHHGPNVQAVQDADADAGDASEPLTTTSTASSPASTTRTSTSTMLSSSSLLHSRAQPLPVPPRTPTTVASPLAQQAGRSNASASPPPSRSAVAAPDFASMLSVLTASVIDLAARDGSPNPAAVTAGGAATTGTLAAAAPASSAPWVEALYCGSLLDNAESTEASYAPYRWLTSSRLPLAIAVESGDLHWCRVSAARVAGWRLLVGMGEAADMAQDARAERRDGATDTEDAGVALVRSYVAFLCRRHHPFALPAQDSSRDGTDTEDQITSTSRSVRALIRVLRELGALVMDTGNRDDEESGSPLQLQVDTEQEDAASISEEERDILRHLLLCAATASSADAEDKSDAAASARLYDVWRTVLECLTVETALLTSCEAAEAAERNEAGTTLQRLVIELAFRPLWTTIQRRKPPTPSPSSLAPPTSATSDPARRAQRLRLEGLLCGYVRLLQSLAAPVDQQLQQLLLEVVLGDAVFFEVAAGDPSTPRRQPPPLWTAAASRAVAEAARRVQRLLGHGTLESNASTARWLLDWWGTYHVAATAATQRRAAAAARDALTAAAFPENAVRDAAPAAEASAELPVVPSSDAAAEAEVVFAEAVRLLEAHGSLLEVAEAHSWRSDFSAAAAVLQRVPRASFNATYTVPAVASWPSASHRRGTRVLTWDALALAALDGAWRGVRWAEEAFYVHAASDASGGQPLQHPQRTVSGLDVAAPKTWAAQALERQMQAAHCTYMTVATTLLVSTARAAAAFVNSNERVHASATGNGGSACIAADAAAATSDCEARFRAHEMRYDQLRRQVEVAGHELKM